MANPKSCLQAKKGAVMDPSILLNNPQLNNISPEKLKFLMELAGQEKGSNPKDMAAALMAASASAQQKGVGFDNSEMDLIVEVLKQNMPENDRKKADMILSMMRGRKK